MKLTVETKPVFLGGVTEGSEFTIKNSAKTFRILSDGLYSNKYRAVIRELACNAYDSHVEAGCPERPFDIQLPTRLEPIFRIRDYGVGLDENGVTRVYTTYGESTKEETNDQTGCLGMGSKSPFSYTDNFTVTAWKDGVKRIYTAYINDRGIPCLGKMGETETDEPNGLEVSFAVTCSIDMQLFSEEIPEVLCWFKHQPNLFNYEGRSLTEYVEYIERDIAGSNTHLVGIASHSGYHYQMDVIAKMGNVVYPVKTKNLFNDNEELKQKLYHLLATRHGGKAKALLLEFEMGALDFAASREELSYDNRTTRVLRERLEEFVAAFITSAREKLEKIPNKWDRAAQLQKLATGMPAYSAITKDLRDLLPEQMMAKDRAHRHNCLLDESWLENFSEKFKLEYKDQMMQADSNKVVQTHGAWTAFLSERGELNPIVLIDKPMALYAIAKHGLNLSHRDSFVRITISNNHSHDNITKEDKQQVIQKIKQAFADHPNFHCSSDFANKIGKISVKSGPKLYKFARENVSAHIRRWKTLPITRDNLKNIEETNLGNKSYRIYVPMKGRQLIVREGFLASADEYMHNSVVRSLETLPLGRDICSFVSKRVVGVKQEDVSKLPGKNWISLNDYVRMLIEEKIESFNTDAKINGMRRYMLDRAVGGSLHVDVFDSIPDTLANGNTPVGVLLSKLNELKVFDRIDPGSVEQINRAIRYYNRDQPDSMRLSEIANEEKFGDYVEIAQNFCETYPLLNRDNFKVDNLQAVVDYIEFINNRLTTD